MTPGRLGRCSEDFEPRAGNKYCSSQGVSCHRGACDLFRPGQAWQRDSERLSSAVGASGQASAKQLSIPAVGSWWMRAQWAQ